MSSLHDNPQTQIFTELAELARCLGNAHRLALLEHIAQGERPVDRLAALSGLSVANTSQHLQHLKRAGFVSTRREGKQIYYRLSSGPIEPLLSALRQCAEHNRAEVQRLIADSYQRPDSLEAISRDELLTRMRESSVTLLDVRPQEEFALGHIPGAVNIPIDELASRFAELPSDQTVIAYCRGPYCLLSVDAIDILAKQGRTALRLKEGYPDWKAAGLAIETPNQPE
ncbi:metalloregulator ArsR/SmtB family transcription factor [Photobacterium sp. MCCC 1A19761]|uniref:ArsR/SmtB family transcription factor n=1 Tax=Photobacterium sp. MCCC 1A19761 TaxID=3115000 RepID=UPI00307E6F09